MAELVWDAVRVERQGRALLADVSLALRGGALTALIGPNGAGKTTLLRAGLGLLPLAGGAVRLNGADIRGLKAAPRARQIAYLPQVRPLAWPLAVRDVVALGRFAHGAAASKPSAVDTAAVSKALEACALGDLAARSTDSLSGGELARVHVARALAAQAPLVVADEPTAALDPLHAHQTMAILKRYCAAGGGALVTLHDLSLAARFADRVALLHRGRLIALGEPAAVLTPALLAEAFGVSAHHHDGHVRISGTA
jgi:iron complex transport system ATP-binding protein